MADDIYKTALLYMTIGFGASLVFAIIMSRSQRTPGGGGGGGVGGGSGEPKMMRCFINRVDVGLPEFVRQFGTASWVVNWRLPKAGELMIIGPTDKVIVQTQIPAGGLLKITLTYINDNRGLHINLSLVHTDWSASTIVFDVTKLP